MKYDCSGKFILAFKYGFTFGTYVIISAQGFIVDNNLGPECIAGLFFLYCEFALSPLEVNNLE